MTKEEAAIRREKIERHKKIESLSTFDPTTYKELELHFFKNKGKSFKIHKEIDPNRMVIDTIYTYDIKTRQERIWYRYGDQKPKNQEGKNVTINPDENCINCPDSKKGYTHKPEIIIPESRSFDKRDGQTYNWMLMEDGNFWMVQNLNYKGIESYCHYDKAENCEGKGRLYTYEVAQEVCPSGWHLPSDDDWWNLANMHGKALNTKVGKEMNKGKKAGTNAYNELIKGGQAGFDAALAGSHNTQLFHLGDRLVGDYWTSSSIGIFYRFKGQRTIHHPATLIRMHPSKKDDAKSVRCIKD